MENPENHFIDSYDSITLCNNSTLQKHERCFNQLWLHRFQCAWDNTIHEAYRSS